MHPKTFHTAILLTLLLAASCTEPLSKERFVRGAGPYVFPVDMTDSTAAYDLDFYTRLDGMEAPPFVELLVRWRSPSDSLFRETVYLSVDAPRRAFSRQIYAPYRADVRPLEPGVWTLTVTVPSRPEGFRGLGLVVRKVK